MAQKPASLPNIDLGARFRIIDERGPVPEWKTLERGYATVKHAREVIARHGLPGVWMVDDFGYKTYILA